MKVEIEVNSETADELVRLSLQDTLDNIQDFIQRYQQPDPGFIAVFDTDPKKDLAKLKKLERGLKRVMKWYGPSRSPA